MSFLNRIHRRVDRSVRPTLRSVGGRRIKAESQVGLRILEALDNGTPFAVGRFGTTEGNLIDALCRNRGSESLGQLITAAWRLSGVFPPTLESGWNLYETYMDVMQDFDLLGVRRHSHDTGFRRVESRLVRDFAPRAALFPIEALSPGNPGTEWLWALGERKLLVVMPFAASLQRYAESPTSFSLGGRPAPQLNFEFLETVQSLSGTRETVGYESWLDALTDQKRRMDQVDFDIALIAGGAYGAPLAVHAKRTGRVGVHIGGALQLLFGLKGSRWTDPSNPDFRSDTLGAGWRFPEAADRVPSADLVENGCYWSPPESVSGECE